MHPCPMLRVVRVGGSLLTWNGLPVALTKWLENQPLAINVLLAGGGPWTQLLRQSAARFHLNDDVAHWMCVRAMSITAELLHRLLPGSSMLAEIGQVRDLGRACFQATNVVFDVQVFLDAVESSSIGEAMPRNWNVTSDSIAARLAEVLPASELVLLKSRLPDATCSTLQGLCETDYTDRHFAQAARTLDCIRCVDLRSAETPEWSWNGD